MTGTLLKEFFEGLIDGENLDTDFTYSLMNFVKDKVEMMRDWEFLKKLDETKSGSGWQTLPTDFLSPVWLFCGTDNMPYQQIPFEQIPSFDVSNSDRKWVIDWRGSRYKVLNSSEARAHRLVYLASTDDITSTTEPSWPAKFHKIIGTLMAELYPIIDGAGKGESWDVKWEKVGKEALVGMMMWDENIKKRANEGGYSIADYMENSLSNSSAIPSI